MKPFDLTSQPRELYTFRRTRCDCAICAAPCKHIPGGLDPSDLEILVPEGENIYSWAEEHLRAVTDKPYPTLVPARQANGHCHWFLDGKCAIHENAPFGCAFFDSHMTQEEIDRRYAATVQARKEDAAAEGLYFKVWQYLCFKGLIARPGDRKALMEEVRKIRQIAERRWRQLDGAS